MFYQDEERHQALIDSLSAYIQQQLSANEAKLLTSFVEQYYANISYDDLCHRSIEEIYASIYSFWQFIYQRTPGQVKVRIFNPSLEKDGWQSEHTIVEVSMDNMPFLVDTVQMAIQRRDIAVHFIVSTGGLALRRNRDYQIIEILPKNLVDQGVTTEAPIYLEIDRQMNESSLEKLQRNLERALHDNVLIVRDWSVMQQRMQDTLLDLERCPPKIDKQEIKEAKEFIRWLISDNFIFFGARDYKLGKEKSEKVLQSVAGSGLGILHRKGQNKLSRYFSKMEPIVREQALSSQILMFAKTNTRSKIHRDHYTDFISVKRFNEQGESIGEHRFVGLYATTAYSTNPINIPLLRYKIEHVLENSGLVRNGHDGKMLQHILMSLPLYDLLQATENELLKLSISILRLQERRKVKLFVRRDHYNRFYSCLVFVPRNHMSTELRDKIQRLLLKELKGDTISTKTTFSDSLLARIHCIVHISPKEKADVNFKEVEKKIIQAGRSWQDELREQLYSHYGDLRGANYFEKYRKVFPSNYRAHFSAEVAINDIEHIENLSQQLPLGIKLNRAGQNGGSRLHLKLFHLFSTVPLSDVFPILENMGLRFIEENPYELQLHLKLTVWVNDFEMTYPLNESLSVGLVKEIFEEAFLAVWYGYAENDEFNRLLLSVQLSWREITVLRAYAKYLKQIGFSFSQGYIAETLLNNIQIARYLIDLFNYRFSPEQKKLPELGEMIEKKILASLDEVSSLDQDRILRRYLEVILATVRTNYFVHDDKNQCRSYLSFKLASEKISDLPLPYPKYEIFVYSPNFEGIHLRCGKVARGGLRWSDRPEDFRTEVLGLMKAQEVKNAVIVPAGAKGGFVVKLQPSKEKRINYLREGIRCYQNFIRGLLDITDNFQDRKVIHPENVVYHDEDDPYLVVAADKGTATFSDIANEISKEYGFWLGDAFASGGSVGYDHKKMGITARGAWESVKRHFREINLDPARTDFTVIGIGDMSGDVFGNGMLLSRHIKLLAAFNHKHIFVDPDPDPKESYAERRRLFKLIRSSWSDYKTEKISAGGGVFSRAAKFIPISAEMQQLFNIKQNHLIPNELICYILKTKVDLLFNGGIGTYVKASNETNADVGDRANDTLRINASDLQCQVVVEGGNLGLTQLARIEYDLNGGRIYTDFIDNSGGVDCSDREVNIKILLNEVMKNEKLSYDARNELLTSMSKQVTELVLEDNRHQTQAISLMGINVENNSDLYLRILHQWESEERIDCEVENLPDSEEIEQRKGHSKTFTRPELAILLAHAKIFMKEDILASTVPEDPYLSKIVLDEFPWPLHEKYYAQMKTHSLRREIVATQLSNKFINQLGITFIPRLDEEVKADLASIMRAVVIAQAIFSTDELWQEIENLSHDISADIQLQMMRNVNQLIRRSTRWLLRYRDDCLDIQELIAQLHRPIDMLKNHWQQFLTEFEQQQLDDFVNQLTEAKVPHELAMKVARCHQLFLALDIVEVSLKANLSIRQVAKAYFVVGESLKISWLREKLFNFHVRSSWDALACVSFRDDLSRVQRLLTVTALMSQHGKHELAQDFITHWLEENEAIFSNWRYFITKLQGADEVELVMFSVGLRELMSIMVNHFPVSPKTQM